jgi:hypothetical protein
LVWRSLIKRWEDSTINSTSFFLSNGTLKKIRLYDINPSSGRTT